MNKELRNKVREMRSWAPAYNHGRRVVIVAADTALGRRIIGSANRTQGYDLDDVYKYYSPAKKAAYDECLEMYRNARHAYGFGICSHNVRMFTVAFRTDSYLIYLTASTEYIVLF